MGKLDLDLNQFTGGTSTWWRNPLYRNYTYTDGVKYIAEQTQSYWLIDYIFSSQHSKELKGQPFQVWKWTATDDNTGFFIVEDGNKNLVAKYDLHFTDFPEGSVTLWFTDNVLQLPNEY